MTIDGRRSLWMNGMKYIYSEQSNVGLISLIINSIDGMDMAIYDEKSDYDNPFVEPLFGLNIYKAKVRPLNDDLVVKTKAMKFVIRCDQVNDLSLSIKNESSNWTWGSRLQVDSIMMWREKTFC